MGDGGHNMLERTKRRTLMAVAIGIAGLLSTGPAVYGQDDVELRESGTIEISSIQIALMWSGSLGGGTLHFNGESHGFTLGGAGFGGVGGSSLKATGTVYNLDSLDQFEGAFGQARTGFVAGSEGSSRFWMENESGVYIELEGDREGLMLAMGADVLYFELD
jgi:hypothetical protein